jgi:predicted nucleotidyltransferase component of viral defense system
MKHFFEMMNDLGRPKRAGIIEKDYQLHRLLDLVQKDEYLSNNLAFKGGTCLIKAHLGYYRFSEDVDFTWKDRTIWDGKSLSAAKRACSMEIDEVLKRFRSIGKEIGLGFDGDKKDPTEVHLSSGGRMVVLYIKYHSELLDRLDHIKVEINFVEDIQYPLRVMPLKTYVDTVRSSELEFLFGDEFHTYSSAILMDCYDQKEIYLEKCRAALTRKVYKFRDIIDIFYLEAKYGDRMVDLMDGIITKTRFSLDLYRRYRESADLTRFPDRVPTNINELNLMIVPPPQELFDEVPRIHRELDLIKGRL